MRASRILSRFLLPFVATVAIAGPAFAHATLEVSEAPANSTYKAVIRIGHGCEGAATTAVRVQVPEGLIVAKPMPKAGWEVTLTEGDYAQTYDYYGTEVTSGVTEIAWTGGNLPDNFYDEFVFRARVTGFEPGTQVPIPVVQECGPDLAERWIEIPAPGEDPDSYEYPAPMLTILAPEVE
jgi:uncharacterized protein YcnI